MATRFWLTASAAPYVPAAGQGAWTDATSSTAGLLGRQPAGTATSVSVAETSGSTANVLLGRWISPPARKAGSLSGSVAWIYGRAQSSASSAMVVRAHLYVTVGDTDAVRGVLLNNYTGGTAFPLTAAGGGTAGISLSGSAAIQVGDRIVCEFGYQAQNASTNAETGTLHYGGTGTTDLVTGNSSVTTNPGWVEFSGADGLFSTPTSEITDKFTTGIGPSFVSSGGTSWDAAWKRAVVPATSSYPGLMAAGVGYEITGSTHHAEIVKTPTGGTNTAFSNALLGPSSNGTYMRIRYLAETDMLSFENVVGHNDATPTTLAYSPVNHRWQRFRESGGTFYWETSPDAATWTVRRSITTPQWVKFGTLRTNFQGYTDAGSTATSAEVDNVNSTPTAVVKVWDGGAWIPKPMKVWNGSSWATRAPKSWSGTAWF